MTVRPADAAALAAIIAEVAAEDRWLLTEPPVDIAAFTPRVQAAIEDGDDALLGLERGDEAVGWAGVHATWVAGVASLGMAVLGAHRGRGRGRALLQAAVDHARATGRHKLELDVFPTTPRPSPSTPARDSPSRACAATPPPPRRVPRSTLLMALLL